LKEDSGKIKERHPKRFLDLNTSALVVHTIKCSGVDLLKVS
jgi:hypothetical protein